MMMNRQIEIQRIDEAGNAPEVGDEHRETLRRVQRSQWRKIPLLSVKAIRSSAKGIGRFSLMKIN